MSNTVPAPRNYGELDKEPFEDYAGRWPREFSRFPRSLVKTWVHRHWIEFSSFWMPMGALNWEYELRPFANAAIMEVLTFPRMMETLDYWGQQLMVDANRQRSWLGKYMLENGSTPEPILLFEGGGEIEHPRGRSGEMMIEPFQLIEGHMRLAYLRGMIRSGYANVRSNHRVFVATPGNGSSTSL